MPAAWIGAIGSLVGAGTSLGSALSGGGGSNVAQGYTPQNLGPADIALFGGGPSGYSGLSGLIENTGLNENAANVQGFTNPNNTSAYNNLIGNPYGGSVVPGAQQGSAYTMNSLIPQLTAGANQLFGLGQQITPYANQALQTGFDPQTSLYNQQYQQMQDQTNAINAMNGVAGSPYGAGLSAQASQNFNTNWQNQQLQRQATAAQTYGNLQGTAGQALAGASNAGSAVPGLYTSAGSAPYTAYQGLQNNNLNASNAYSGAIGTAAQPSISLMAPLLSYLGLAPGFTGANTTAANSAFNQGQTIGGNIGSGISGATSGLSSLASLYANNNPSQNYSGAANLTSTPYSYLGGGYTPSAY